MNRPYVDLNGLSDRTRNNYLYARAMVGRELAALQPSRFPFSSDGRTSDVEATAFSTEAISLRSSITSALVMLLKLRRHLGARVSRIFR